MKIILDSAADYEAQFEAFKPKLYLLRKNNLVKMFSDVSSSITQLCIIYFVTICH